MIKKLKLLDRILLGDLFSNTKASLTTLLIVESIINKTKISIEEIDIFEIKSDSDMSILWNSKGEKEIFPIELNDLEVNEIRNKLKKMSQEHKLSIQFLPLCKIFDVTE